MDPTLDIIGYRIIRPLGAGGMGEVHLALQESLQRHVAIKLIRGSLVDNEETVQRFLKEGEIVAKLTHPGIIKVFDTGRHGDRLYLAMEYLDGGTLKERITQSLPLPRKLEIFRTLLDALGYAHQQGIIHRDIKPQNILFYPQGIPVLSDFGIAKALALDATNLTGTAMCVGSPRYMSPEQIRGEPIDHRIDIYAMGVLFYELLLEETIYSTVTDPFALALHHVSDPVPRLPVKFAAFQPVLDQMMAKSRDERFPDAASAIVALEKAAADHGALSGSTTRVLHKPPGKDVSRQETPPPVPHLKPKTSRTVVLSLALIAGLAAAGGLGFYLTRPQLVEPTVTQLGDNLQRHAETTRIFLQATGLYQQGDYSAALAALDAGLQSWPDAAALLDLRQVVAARIAEHEREEAEQLARERRQAIDGYHDRAMAALEAAAFEESLAVLDEGLGDWPDADTLTELRMQVLQRRDEHLEQQRQAELERLAEIERQAEMERQRLAAEARRQAIAQILDTAENQRAAGEFETSLATLDEGLTHWPDASELRDLRRLIADQLDEQQQRERAERERREQMVAQTLSEAEALQAANEFESALALLDSTLDAWPDADALLTLREQVEIQFHHQQAEEERRQAIAQIAETAEIQRADEDFEASLTTLDEGLEQWPEAEALATLRTRIVEELDEQRRLAAERARRTTAIEDTIAQVDNYESKFDYDTALAQLDETMRNWPDAEELAALRAQIIQRRNEYLEQLRQAELERQRLAERERQRQAEEKRRQMIDRITETAEARRAEADYEASLAALDEGLRQWPEAEVLATLRVHVAEQLDEQRRLATEDALSEPVDDRSELIAELLDRADKQFTAQLLTTPAGNNAYETYREILEIDADNQAAHEGLERIAQQYVTWAESNKRARNYSRSLVFIERGLGVIPGYNALLSLQEEVVALRRQATSSPRTPAPSLPAPKRRQQTPTAERPLDNAQPAEQPAKEPPQITAPSATSPSDSTFEAEPPEKGRRPSRIRPFGTF